MGNNTPLLHTHTRARKESVRGNDMFLEISKERSIQYNKRNKQIPSIVVVVLTGLLVAVKCRKEYQ